MDVKTNLAELRARRGLGAAQLAEQIGVSRQTVYAIEAGTYVPNTAVSLKLARALEASVEEIFQLKAEPEPIDEIVEAAILGDFKRLNPGQPLQLCRVDRNLVGVAQESNGWALPPADGVLLEQLCGDRRIAKVHVVNDKWKKPNRILISGCDPSVSILSQTLQAQDCELIAAYENSSRALESLRDGLVHIAGSHLVNKATGKTDLLSVTKMFGRNAVAVFAYALWEEGMVVASGNPKRIGGVADLARKGVRFANREPGAGCRHLLDDLLRKEGISTRQIAGYERIAVGHLSAARLVRDDEVDCCISTQVVARALSLDFIPLARKPYQLVVRRSYLKLPAVQSLLETLGRTSFRREVEASTGYDMSAAGDRCI